MVRRIALFFNFFGMGGFAPTPFPHLHYSETHSSPEKAFVHTDGLSVSELFKEILASLV